MPAQIYWSASIFKNLSLAVTPQIGMAVTSSSTTAELDLAVTPQIGFTLSQRAGDLGLSATPQIGMAGSSVSAADLDLSVTPQIGMLATGSPEVDFALQSGSPQIGMAGAAVSSSRFALGSGAPQIGMLGTPGSRPVTFDAVGAGSGSAVAVSSLSWSHTATAGAYVFVDVGTAFTPSSVKYGGVSMTLLGSQAVNNNPAQGSIFRYGLAGVAGGAQTVVVTFASNSAGNANSISYNNVGVVGALQVAYGDGSTTASQSVTCAAGQYIVQGIGAADAAAMTVSGGTDRYASFTGGASLAITDSTTSTTFSTSTGAGVWAALATVLSPITVSGSGSLSLTPTITASGKRIARSSATRTITPLITASGIRTARSSAALTTTPSIVPVGRLNPGHIQSGTTITPAITASGFVKKGQGASLTVTPNVSASGKVIRHGSASLTVTPSVSGAGTVLSGAVSYDTTGAGATSNGGTTWSWSHTAAVGTAAIVIVSTNDGSHSYTASWGATSMTNLGSIANGPNKLWLFGLTGVGTGSAVTVTVNASGGNASVSANSVSYTGVTGFGTPVTATGTSAAPSVTVSSSNTHRVFAAFGTTAGGGRSFSGFSGTSRINGTTNCLLYAGDDLGSSSLTVSATANTSLSWTAIGVDIL